MSSFKETIWSSDTLRYENNRLRMINGEVNDDDIIRFDKQMYANFFNRTGLIFTIREYKIPATRQRPPRPEEILISCVSSDLILGGTNSDLVKVNCRDNCSLLGLQEDVDIRDWRAVRLTELREVAKSNPNIICFGELTYPPPNVPCEYETIPDYLFNYGSDRREFEAKAKDILKEQGLEAFTFLGSYHCLQSLYNVGVIFPLGYQPANFTVVTSEETLNDKESLAPSFETKDMLSVITYLKRFPARRAGEEIRVPTGNKFEVYETEFGRIAILVCSDIVDLNQFMVVARRNLSDKYEPIDIVLVPSFNKSQRLVSMCRELSYLANTVVINVNANNDDEKFPNTGIFVCGLDTEQLPENYVASKQRKITHPGEKARSSTIYEFHLKRGVTKLRDAALRSHPTKFRGSGSMRAANF